MVTKEKFTIEKIKEISKIKNEPKWMLDFRLKAFEKFTELSNPIFEDEYVKTVTENKENRTWSDLWLSVTKEKYVKDANFQELWKYIYENDIK